MRFSITIFILILLLILEQIFSQDKNSKIWNYEIGKKSFVASGAKLKYIIYDTTFKAGHWGSDEFVQRRDINQRRLSKRDRLLLLFESMVCKPGDYYSPGGLDATDGHRYGRLEILRRI